MHAEFDNEEGARMDCQRLHERRNAAGSRDGNLVVIVTSKLPKRATRFRRDLAARRMMHERSHN